MSSPVQGLIISLVAMQFARKIPFEEPQTLNLVRAAYIFVQIITLSTYYIVAKKVRQKNDQTVLKYVESGNPIMGQQSNLITTTVKDYDLNEVSKLVRGVYTGLAMMAFLHLYFKYTQPLFVQSLMGIKAIYDAKPVAIHILGKPAEGDLKRPFKAGGSMFGASSATDPATDKAAIDEAEKKIGSTSLKDD